MKKIVLVLLLIPFFVKAQLHVGFGAVDVHERQDGYTIASQIGYTHFFNRIGAGANYRNTSIRGDIYYTLESQIRYRLANNPKYRMDIGFGAGYNLDDYDVHPLGSLRNSIKIYDNLWVDLSIDNAYRNSKDIIKPGWRWETYLMFGFSMDFIN